MNPILLLPAFGAWNEMKWKENRVEVNKSIFRFFSSFCSIRTDSIVHNPHRPQCTRIINASRTNNNNVWRVCVRREPDNIVWFWLASAPCAQHIISVILVFASHLFYLWLTFVMALAKLYILLNLHASFTWLFSQVVFAVSSRMRWIHLLSAWLANRSHVWVCVCVSDPSSLLSSAFNGSVYVGYN